MNDDGFNFVANSFMPVGKTVAAATLGDIGVNEEVTSGTAIQLLDNGGATQVLPVGEGDEFEAIFVYLNQTRAAKKGVDAGWYFQDDEDFLYCQNDLVIPVGSGVMVDCSDSGAALVFSGEVIKGEVTLALNDDGFNFTGNASPCQITLGDITVNDEVTSGTAIQFLDNGGATKVIEVEDGVEFEAILVYLNETRAAKKGKDAGWYFQDDEDFEYCQNSTILEAGQGFMVDCSDSGAELYIPAAINE